MATETPAKAKPATQVVTGVVRGSYLTLFEPKPKNKDKPDEKFYSMVLLIPKSDTKTLNAIAAAQEAAVAKMWPNQRPAKINLTLHDGNGVKPESGEPYGPECKDHMVMNVSSTRAPSVVDQSVNPIMDKGSIVSGDYFRVSMNFFGYENSGKKGVSAGLNNVQFIRKGEPLGNVTRPEDDFDPVEDDILG